MSVVGLLLVGNPFIARRLDQYTRDLFRDPACHNRQLLKSNQYRQHLLTIVNGYHAATNNANKPTWSTAGVVSFTGGASPKMDCARQVQLGSGPHSRTR